jgi:hypothetical protein
MQELARGRARCSFIAEDGVFEFDVAAVPEYGVVQVDLVVAGSRDASTTADS